MYWQPRRFARLAELPDERLFPELETGLGLVAQNATRLADAATALWDQGHPRPARILASHAEDEAGKFLVLLDAARCPRQRLQEHLRRSANHLARLLYAETAKIFPATFGELRRYIDGSRQSHYVDGPEGVEWVYRNSMLFGREQDLYVDYVEDDKGACTWQDPDRFAKILTLATAGPFTFAADLVAALVEARLHLPPALAIIAARWRPFAPHDDTHIAEVRRLVEETLKDLDDHGLFRGSREAWQRIVEHWTFPLWDIDLSEERVSLAALREEQEGYSPE